MSLKAKLEAVIYAAEEPVTLAQLAVLFGDEALEWRAEQDAAAASAASSATEATMPPLNEAFAYLELEPGEAKEAAAQGEEGAGEVVVSGELESNSPAAEAGAGALTESAGLEAHTTAGPPPQQAKSGLAGDPGLESGATTEDTAEAEAKQKAKQRDREARAVIKQILGELIAEYAVDGRGIEIREVAGGYRMATKPQFHDAVRSFVKGLKPPLKLSLPALETLAVIAYKQPVTAPEVNEIRGVDSSGVFGSLLARKLIVTAGRKQVVGRPILYKTTREFLLRFGLKDVSELPSMEEFEKMAASELEADETAEESASSGEAEEFTGDPSVEQAESDAPAPETAGLAESESKPSEATEGDAVPASGAE
jgi:segregation and condensation protein B